MMIRNLAKSLTRYQTPDIRGSIITKVSLERLVSNLSPITYDYQLLKLNRNVVVLESQGVIDERVICRLTVTLLLGHSSANSKEESSFEEKKGAYFQTISRQQVIHFIDETNDLNPIHQSECPIVPGLLLLQLLDEAYQYPSQIKIKFRAPLYAEQSIYLKKQRSKVWGYSRCHLCFEAEIKK